MRIEKSSLTVSFKGFCLVAGLFLLAFFILTLPREAGSAGPSSGTPEVAPNPAAPQNQTILVLPFEIHAGPEGEKLKEGLPELISEQLTKAGLSVVPKAKMKQVVKDHNIDTVDLKVARELALLSGAGYTLYGSFSQIGETISIDARLVDGFGFKSPRPLFVVKAGMIELLPAVQELVEKLKPEMSSRIKIAAVEVRGNNVLEKDVITLRMKTQVGDDYNPMSINADLKRLYDLGFFEDIEIWEEDVTGGRKLIVDVKEKPRIMAVGVHGNKDIDEDDIKAAMSTKTGAVLNMKILSDDISKIRELYKKKAYYNVKVSYELEGTDPRQARLSILVDEGRKLYIKEINIEGAKEISPRTIKGELALSERGFLSWFTGSGILKEELLERDAAAIEAYYANRGFIDARSGQPDVKFAEDGIYITFKIQEGNRYKVGKIGYKGDLLMPVEKFDSVIKLKKMSASADYFDRSVMRDDTQILTDMYTDMGYAFADVDPMLNKHPEDNTVDVDFNFTKNQKIYIRRVSIQGNNKTRDNVVRREMRLGDGDLFSGTKLRRSNERLNKIDYFEQVDIEPVQTNNPGQMDLKIKLKEKPTGMISMGAGYSSFDQFFVSGQIEERNLFGKGYGLGFRGTIGGRRTAFQVYFNNPSLYDSLLGSGVDVYVMSDKFTNYKRDTAGSRLNFSYPLGEYTRAFWSYRLDRYYITDVNQNVAQVIKDQEGYRWASVISLSAVRDTTDRRINPSKGSTNSLFFDFAGGPLMGDDNFIRVIGDTNWYFPLFWGTIFHWHAQAGYMMPNTSKETPVTERFYLGGMNSVRGYSTRKIGPTDPVTGDDIGGEAEFFTNFEYLFPLQKDIGLMGVAFFDAGNSWERSNIDGKLYKGVGIGIRWYSPMGPMRLEYGYGLDPLKNESRNKFEFSVGQFF